MRTGADYRATLRDGRKIWVAGEGVIDDVTTHPATRAMVDEYVAWYDLHRDPAWEHLVLTPPDEHGARTPWGAVTPRSPADLQAMGRCFAATIFPSAGNITHTPAYGYLIALGVLETVHQAGAPPEQIANAAAYRDSIARTGRFLTFSGGSAPIGHRLREDPHDRAALRPVRETDAGVVVTGKIGMLTSPAYAEDVYVGALSGVDLGGHRVSFIIPVNAPGVTVFCRKISARHPNRFVAPMSQRYDELDGQMWFDDVFVPWERVFFTGPTPESIATWLFWHQLYCWHAKSEFTLGLAIACAHAMGLKEHDLTIEYIVDLIADVQMIRTCLTAGELDPYVTRSGYLAPGYMHIAVGNIAMQKVRQRITETLRILPGSSLVVAPSDGELATPEIQDALEDAFGGGGYTAQQRSALLQMAWDHIASALDGRESAFELHANGGMPAWRGRIRRNFDRYNELANRVVGMLGLDMPKVDATSIKEIPMAPRRQVTPPKKTT